MFSCHGDLYQGVTYQGSFSSGCSLVRVVDTSVLPVRVVYHQDVLFSGWFYTWVLPYQGSFMARCSLVIVVCTRVLPHQGSFSLECCLVRVVSYQGVVSSG